MTDINISSTVELVSEHPQYGGEYRLVVDGMAHGFFTGTREQAAAEARRIAHGLEGDRRWFARCLPCRSGDHAACEAEAGDCTNICHPSRKD